MKREVKQMSQITCSVTTSEKVCERYEIQNGAIELTDFMTNGYNSNDVARNLCRLAGSTPCCRHLWTEYLCIAMADSKHFEIPKASVRKIMKTNDEVSHISAVSEGGLQYFAGLCVCYLKQLLLACLFQYE